MSPTKAIRQIAGAIVAIGMFGVAAHAQVPEKRVRSEQRIPTQKEIPAKPSAPIVVPGKNTVVYETPVVTRLVRSEAGTPVVIVEQAPTVAAKASLLPLLGLLGGAALVGTTTHGNSATESGAAQTPPPVAPPQPTVVPEPATMSLLATGFAGVAAFARRRRRS